MKKLDNFLNCLKVLEKADFSLAENDEIYRTGIIGQFNLTFELAWKALQQVLRLMACRKQKPVLPEKFSSWAIKWDSWTISPYGSSC